MNMDLEQELYLKSYLLGDLNPEEQERLEKRLMMDTAAIEELRCMEDELIEDYLEGTLPGHERERFENFFLAAPERKQKLSFSKSLKRYVAAHQPEKSRKDVWLNSWKAFWHPQYQTLKWAFTSSLIFLIAGGFWHGVRISNLQNMHQLSEALLESRMAEFQTKNLELIQALRTEQDHNSQLKQGMADLQRASKPGTSPLPEQEQPLFILASLNSIRSRSSGDIQKITVPSGDGVVQLDLKMDPLEYPRYQVILQRGEGDIILNQTEASIKGYFPGLFVSAELLTPGGYELSLNGITADGNTEEIGTYYFQIIRE